LAGRAGLQRLHLPEDHNRCLSREHALLPLVENGQHQWMEATAAPDETTLDWRLVRCPSAAARVARDRAVRDSEVGKSC
jgi:hypothetical protein